MERHKNPRNSYIYLHEMQAITSASTTKVNSSPAYSDQHAGSCDGVFISVSGVAPVPGCGGVGADVPDVLRRGVPRGAGHHQERCGGRREQRPPHGCVAAPAALP